MLYILNYILLIYTPPVALESPVSLNNKQFLEHM
jgi:hypothetical protein